MMQGAWVGVGQQQRESDKESYINVFLRSLFLIFSFVVWLIILCRESQCIILSLNILRTLVRLNAGGTHPGTILTTSTHSTSPSCCAATKLCWVKMPLCITTSWRQVWGPSVDNLSTSHCNSFSWCWGLYFLLRWSRSWGDAGGVVVTNNKYEAYCPDEYMWLAASCRDTPSHCILYLSAGDGWGIAQILQRASAYNLPVAFGVAAWGDFVEIPKTFKSFLARFFWNPTVKPPWQAQTDTVMILEPKRAEVSSIGGHLTTCSWISAQRNWSTLHMWHMNGIKESSLLTPRIWILELQKEHCFWLNYTATIIYVYIVYISPYGS